MRSIFPPKKRIIVIGDIHGDYKLTLMCLSEMKLINNKGDWCGGSTWVVQMGDQVDRGGRGQFINDENSDIRIINLFEKLNNQAVKTGGAVISLLGNHELMNVMGNYNYVSPLGISEFGGCYKRYEYFKPGGMVCQLLKKRPVIIKIGSYVFVHAGIKKETIKNYSFDSINNMMKRFLTGDIDLINNKSFIDLFIGPDSLLWSREFSKNNFNMYKCNNLLKTLKCNGIVVGHTIQYNINTKFNKIWFVDTGMSEAFGKGSHKNMELLEIINDGKIINIHKF